MKNNAQKLKAKIKRAIKTKNPIFMDLHGLQHLNKIHVLMKRCGIKLDDSYNKGMNHIEQYEYYHYPSKLNMGLSVHPNIGEYMILNWRPSEGSNYERKNTIKLL